MAKSVYQIAIQWRRDGNSYRVWRTDWSGDQFEVVGYGGLREIEQVCRRFSIPFSEADDD